MKTRYRSRLTGEFFKTEKEVIEALKKEEIEEDFELYYDVISLSEEDIAEMQKELDRYCEKYPDDPSCVEHRKKIHGEVDETPEDEEALEKSSAITEREKLAIELLEDYSNIENDSDKKRVLSIAMGMATGKDKKFPMRVTTKDSFKEYYEDAVEKLLDEKMVSCPLCGKLWKNIYEEKREKLAQHSNLEVKVPLMRISHIRSEHKGLWRIVQHLFGKGAQDMPDTRVSTVPNPEHCSENLEELTKEELAQKIGESPELRKRFFREWMRRLQEKN